MFNNLNIYTNLIKRYYIKTIQQIVNDIVTLSQQELSLYTNYILHKQQFQVRIYGSFRTLTDKINTYLQAGTPAELFAKILERLEGDFEVGDENRFESFTI